MTSPYFGTVLFTPEALAEMGKVIAAMIVEQITVQGINADGLALPPGVDLQETGTLLASIEAKIATDGITIACGASYAVYVDARYHFFGIAPQNYAELYRRLTPIAAKGAFLESTK